jgi:thiamine kinase-like enzyme
MKDSAFKQHAKQLDVALSSAQFTTLVHGDAKFANLCFHHNGQNLAAVDFQYVGHGSGVKDLAYLAGSCLTDELLYEYEQRIVDEYLRQINLAVTHYGVDINIDAFEQETRYLYPIAWADFYRFLLGWNPQSWKIGQFMDDKSHQGLALLKR